MTSLYYYSIFLVFGIVAFMIIVDNNVADYLLLSLKMIKINFERLKWMIVFHPKNPITRWYMDRKMSKFIKEMQASLETVQSD